MLSYDANAGGPPPTPAQTYEAADQAEFYLGTTPLNDPELARILRTLVDHARTCEQSEQKLRRQLINTPLTSDFMAGVPLEAQHQRERWGVEHDAGKTSWDWFWLIGYLAQKAAAAAEAGDQEKALHHTVSTAAALANWHAALTGASSEMRPGIVPPGVT